MEKQEKELNELKDKTCQRIKMLEFELDEVNKVEPKLRDKKKQLKPNIRPNQKLT